MIKLNKNLAQQPMEKPRHRAIQFNRKTDELPMLNKKHFSTILLLIILLFFSSTLHAVELLEVARYVNEEELLNREIDPFPEGKIIETIYIHRADPFIAEEWYLNFPNYLHPTTRESVIFGELLFEEGDPYNQELVDESARIIREMRIMHDCQIFPLRRPEENKVDIIIETRDQWTLNIDLKPTIDGNKFHLQIHATERNIAGFNKEAAVWYHLDNFLHSVFLWYIDQRILGSDFSLDINTQFGFQLEDGSFDGYEVNFNFGLPLRSIYDQWSFYIMGKAADRTDYLFNYSENEISRFTIQPRGVTGKWEEWALPITTEFQQRYFLEDYQGGFTLEKIFGVEYRFILGGGYMYRYQEADYYNNIEDGDYGYSREELVDYFKSIFFHIYNYPELELYTGFEIKDFLTIEGFNSFNRTEDIPMGVRIIGGIRMSHKYLGALEDHRHYEPFAEFYYGLNGMPHILLFINAIASTQITHNKETLDYEFLESQFDAYIKFFWMSAPFGYLSFQMKGGFVNKTAAGLPLRLGSDTLLRGYQPNTFEGNRMMVFNLEYRTDPYLFFDALDAGAVVFYDVGNAWDGTKVPIQEVKFYHSIGFGLRTVLVFLNPNVLRLDFGFGLTPLNQFDRSTGRYRTRNFNFTFTLEYGQSF